MKNILLLLFLSAPLVGGAPLPADDHTGKPACCGLSAAAVPFTKKSLYQSEAGFTTDAGASFSLGELRGYPVVLAMFFTSCGYACPLIVSDMQAIRAQLPAEVRDRTRFVLVSFDTIRDTPDALAKYRAMRSLEAPWVLLHGNANSVRELAALLGVKYQQEADGAFSHSNLITLLNPEGEVIHQRAGLQGGIGETVATLTTSCEGK